MNARKLFSYAIFALSTVRYHSVISLKRVVRKTACANFAGVIFFASPLTLFGCAAIDFPPVRACRLYANPLTSPDDSKVRFVAASLAEWTNLARRRGRGNLAGPRDWEFALRCARRNCYSTSGSARVVENGSDARASHSGQD